VNQRWSAVAVLAVIAAAESALERLAATLKVDRIAAAEGVHRVVNTTMEGIRLVSVRRGVDPRRFALAIFILPHGRVDDCNCLNC
jgi:N-methylhydantoinase A/oxoprolinase/acetone carboxylase beta subunit